MSAYDLVLIDVLRRLAVGIEPTPERHPVDDVVKAAFLVVSSASVEAIQRVEMLGFETLKDERTGAPAEVSGVSLPSVPCHVADVVDALMDCEEVPKEVTAYLGEITLDEYRAAIFAVRCILHALHRASYPLSPPPETVSDEDRARVLRRSLRQLEQFRRTGEP